MNEVTLSPQFKHFVLPTGCKQVEAYAEFF